MHACLLVTLSLYAIYTHSHRVPLLHLLVAASSSRIRTYVYKLAVSILQIKKIKEGRHRTYETYLKSVKFTIALLLWDKWNIHVSEKTWTRSGSSCRHGPWRDREIEVDGEGRHRTRAGRHGTRTWTMLRTGAQQSQVGGAVCPVHACMVCLLHACMGWW